VTADRRLVVVEGVLQSGEGVLGLHVEHAEAAQALADRAFTHAAGPAQWPQAIRGDRLPGVAADRRQCVEKALPGA